MSKYLKASALFLCLFMISRPLGASSFFDPAVNYAVGDDPKGIIAADLDGDGNTDLATSNMGSNNVSVLLNVGDGTFESAVNYASGTYLYSISGGDFDGDNDFDLAVVNVQDNTVSVLLNNGDGTFAAAVSYAVDSGPWRLIAAELNGDNYYDLAVTNLISGSFSILLSNGDGSFAEAVNYPTGQPWEIDAADIDGDGDNDLAIASGSVHLYLNDGSGSFTSSGSYGENAEEVFFADIDQDGDIDIVQGWPYWEYGRGFSVYKNDGTGIFSGPSSSAWVDVHPKALILQEHDGDGDNDVIVSQSGSIWVMENNGVGGFGAQVSYGTGSGSSAHELCGADFNGDGNLDVATANESHDNVSILINQGSAYTVNCGDVNSTGDVNLLDITYLIEFLYFGGPPPDCD